MAWTWKLVAATNDVPGEDGDGNPITVDLSKQGKFLATFDVFSDTAATVKVDTRSYELPHTVSRADAIDRINADVARMRDARARVATLTADIGVKVTVP